MRMKRTILAGLIAASCAASLSLTAYAQPSRLDDVLERGFVRVCTTGDYSPYTFFGPDGQFIGIDIDLARSLATTLGVDVQFVQASWPTLISDFVGKCDIAMGGISITAERQEYADFSESHMSEGKSPIARCDDVGRFPTLDAIDQPGVRAIVNPGGTNERFARRNFHRLQLIVHPDNTTIFEQILLNNADVMVTDTSEALWQSRLHPQLCPINPGQPFETADKAYMLPRGDHLFKASVDAWMQEMKRSGRYAGIVDSWLKGTP